MTAQDHRFCSSLCCAFCLWIGVLHVFTLCPWAGHWACLASAGHIQSLPISRSGKRCGNGWNEDRKRLCAVTLLQDRIWLTDSSALQKVSGQPSRPSGDSVPFPLSFSVLLFPHDFLFPFSLCIISSQSQDSKEHFFVLSKTWGLTSIELLLNDVLYPHINSSKGHEIKEQQGNSMLIALFAACRKKRGGGVTKV